MSIIIIAVVLVILGGGCIVLSFMHQQAVNTMAGTETFTAAQLNDMCGNNGTPGKPTFQKMVEVKGTIETQQPLLSHLSMKQCVYSHTVIQEKTEEWRKGSDGEMHSYTKWRTVNDWEESCPFFVNDGTGKIEVFPTEAQFIGDTITDDFEDSGNSYQSDMNHAMDAIGLDVAVGDHNWGGGRSVKLGEKKTETIIPVNVPVYVLGEATDAMGRTVIAMPLEGDSFIVSMKSEEELTESSNSSATMFQYLGFILIAAGAIAGAWQYYISI
jgi:hypothetical protein